MNYIEAIISTIAATVISMIFTICYTAWRDKKEQKEQIKKEKLDLFKKLIEVRFLPVSYDKTRALNLIDIVF